MKHRVDKMRRALPITKLIWGKKMKEFEGSLAEPWLVIYMSNVAEVGIYFGVILLVIILVNSK